MKKPSIKDTFHYISYLQYPLMLLALFYIGKLYYDIFAFRDRVLLFQDINNILLFMGVAISFSALQDTNKTQNKLSRRIWESPKKGKIALGLLFFSAFTFMVFGGVGLFLTANEALAEVSIGLLVLGIGEMGLLKTAIEMFENHRLDKKIS
ncbi:hypothetical protein JHJ32_11270 [Parapedobacter sp. ISTM3]|uniref:Uncharacterized protein n=1 Tax=Parapedobacter luteus TaxID=623280 RepID=A0A1T5D0I3_9SPHI|nr:MULTISPECIES: hypothetical protein [Parapedobacter]MBK1440568.1 hypothetical protein [Parapedobacter sp. ISTM3]SKB65214.1 hypothetical protein SAMN05660226_02524 [Parapedobacter luteus]